MFSKGIVLSLLIRAQKHSAMKLAMLSSRYVMQKRLIVLSTYQITQKQKLFVLFISGINIIRNALRVPITQIVKNTGADPTPIVEKVAAADNQNMGYDALNSQFVDMFEAGIIDPTKVSRLRSFVHF